MSDITLADSQGNCHFRGQFLNFETCLLGSVGFHSPAQLVCNSLQMPKKTVHKENHRDQWVRGQDIWDSLITEDKH